MAAAVTSLGPFGRGRGRGRGLSAAVPKQPGLPATTQGIPQKSSLPETVYSAVEPKVETLQSDKDIPCIAPSSSKAIGASTENTTSQECNNKIHCTVVKDIIKRMGGLTESEIMKTILPEIEVLKKEEIIEDLVKALSEKALLDASFAITAAKLTTKVWDNDSLHSLIRNPLLKQTQMNYLKRDELRKENQFYGLCVYVCELFKHLRVKEKPLRPVGEAVVQLLKELMQKNDKPSDEDVFYFYQELESMGRVIEEMLPEKMEEIINIARQMVISSSLIPSMRCRLVQLIELHAAKWEMKDDLKIMYDDLQQDLMSEGK